MRPIRWVRRGIALVGLGIAGGAVAVTARHLLETPQPLESKLPGEGRIDRRHGGDVYYNVIGPEQATPLVLLHDFYPGASNYEFRHIMPRFAVEYRVFAPDWLGFGMSERPAIAYTGEFYATMLAGFLRDVVGRPAIVLANGRAANIAVRVAADAPKLVERLVLVSPYTEAGTDLEPSIPQAIARAAQRTALGLVLYAGLSSRPVLRVSRHVRGGEAESSLEQLYAAAHQFGGQHAQLALMTGELDLPMQHAFALLEPPVLIIGGEHDLHHSPADLEDLAILNPHADLEIVPDAGSAPFEDAPAAFAERTRGWLHAERARRVPGNNDYLPTLVMEVEEEQPPLAERDVVVVFEPTEIEQAEQAEQRAQAEEIEQIERIKEAEQARQAEQAEQARQATPATPTTPEASAAPTTPPGAPGEATAWPEAKPGVPPDQDDTVVLRAVRKPRPEAAPTEAASREAPPDKASAAPDVSAGQMETPSAGEPEAPKPAVVPTTTPTSTPPRPQLSSRQAPRRASARTQPATGLTSQTGQKRAAARSQGGSGTPGTPGASSASGTKSGGGSGTRKRALRRPPQHEA